MTERARALKPGNPATIGQNPVLTLPADSIVTASYADDQQASGPGTVILGDIAQPKRRIIYGDEPKPQ